MPHSAPPLFPPPPRTGAPAARWRLRVGVSAAFAAALLAVGPGQAAPVGQDDAPRAPDPYELAARWTMASLPATVGGGVPLSALPAWPAAAPAPAGPSAPPRFTALPMATGGTGVPDPGSYALMGLLLLAAGLAVHQWRRGRAAAQRGFSKKT